MRLISLGHNQNPITIGDNDFYFSYNTCVAVRNEKGNFRIKSVSKTTAKHMTSMGIKDWPVITEEELNTYFPQNPPTSE